MITPRVERSVGALVLAGIVIAATNSACSDGPTPPPPPPPAPLLTPVVSEPLAAAMSVSASRGSHRVIALLANGSSGAAAERLVYVSLPTGAYPIGRTAIIRNTLGRASVTQPMLDGGFDPIAIPAGVGDTIAIEIRDGSLVVARLRLPVPRSRPPRVVRTTPPKGKRDVALNSRITIIFSEPIDPATLTASSITLSRDGTPLPGSLEVIADGLAVDFVPSSPFARSAVHRLLVTDAVRDAESDPLDATVAVEFTTGTTSTSPVTSVDVTPSAATLEMGDVLGDSVQLAVTVRTAQGIVANREVLWSTSAPSVAVVSSGGLVMARAPGLATITATSEGRTDSVRITVTPIAVARIELSPLAPTLDVGGTVFVSHAMTDRNGQVLILRPITWASDNVGIATVDQRGLVAGIAPGTARITATSEGVSGTTTIEVGGTLLLDRVEVDPRTPLLAVGTTVQLTARAYRCDPAAKTCSEVIGRPVAWSSANEAVATVSATGHLTAVSPGAVQITAVVDGMRRVAPVTVLPSMALALTSVSAGYYFTCGLTAAGKAYCWGQNPFGELGIGVHARLAEWTPAAVAPVAVAGGLTFTSISVGGWHVCGLTTSNSVYCWGLGLQRQLGQSSHEAVQACAWSEEADVQCAVVPSPVAGAPALRAIYAGGLHTCGLTLEGMAYCWGGDRYGQIGDGGGATLHGLLPTPVAGNHRFQTLSPGARHVCGLTIQGRAYCWGWNFHGQLGDGSHINRDVPVPVAGDLTFASLTSLAYHTCGVTTRGDAYCWGDNYYGQLGDGSHASSNVPVPVRGGPFTLLAVGEFHTCGLTAGGAVECWGANWFGELGSGRGPGRTTPSPIAGGLTFATLTLGASHACGLTSGQVAYCWGANQSGQLGDGSATNRYTPERMAGQP